MRIIIMDRINIWFNEFDDMITMLMMIKFGMNNRWINDLDLIFDLNETEFQLGELKVSAADEMNESERVSVDSW